jgi:hypothetical protein
MNNYPQGIVCIKDHPTLKFGQIVLVIEVTADLYKVKADKKSAPTIISKKDLRMQ